MILPANLKFKIVPDEYGEYYLVKLRYKGDDCFYVPILAVYPNEEPYEVDEDEEEYVPAPGGIYLSNATYYYNYYRQSHPELPEQLGFLGDDEEGKICWREDVK